jgi:LemA protein
MTDTMLEVAAASAESTPIILINPIYIIAVIGIIIIVFIIAEYNKFVQLKHKIKQAKSGIDVYLTQRFDLIPNLVECVKGYAAHEEKVFTEMARLRSEYSKNKDLRAGSELYNKCNEVLALGETNPYLQASDQFLNLQKSIIKMESQLQAARRIYNGDVTLYNTTISTFPNSFFASLFGFHEEELFVIEEYKRENVVIK